MHLIACMQLHMRFLVKMIESLPFGSLLMFVGSFFFSLPRLLGPDHHYDGEAKTHSLSKRHLNVGSTGSHLHFAAVSLLYNASARGIWTDFTRV